jgi:hypothetical protein
MRILACLLVLACGAAFARDRTEQAPRFAVAERDALSVKQIYNHALPRRGPAYTFVLTLAYFDSEWSRHTIVDATRGAARILTQCGVWLRRVDVVRIDAPSDYQYFYTPRSRVLAAALHLHKPTVYFVADTLQQPAFDAEAIGRGNSHSRPELVDTIWITRATPEVRIALAHELVHVLSDSGAHSNLAHNLMRDETAPENTRLTDAQCARVRDIGVKHELLKPQ